MIAEFKNYCVSPSQLFQCVNESTEAMNWSIQSSKKINDLALLYDTFEKVSLNKYLMSEDYYALLSEQIATVKQSRIVIFTLMVIIFLINKKS